MQLTDTSSKREFVVNRPNTPVTFVMPDLTDQSRRVTIKIPQGSKWTPGPHWHEKYDEYFQVVQGRIIVIINRKSQTVVAENGPQCVPRYAVHQFMRADINKPKDEEDLGEVIVQEWIDPTDGSKEGFFRNIFSIVQDAPTVFGRFTGLQIWMTSAHFDNYDVVLPGPMQWFATHTICLIYSGIGRLMGFKPWYEEYTPSRIRDAVMSVGLAKKIR